MIYIDFIIAVLISIIVLGIIRFFYYFFIKYILITKIMKRDKKTKFNYKDIFHRTLLELIWIKYQKFKLKRKK